MLISPCTGGGSPGRGGRGGTPSTGFSVPAVYEKTILLGELDLGGINITNLATSSETFNVKIESLDEIIILQQENITISGRSTGQVSFIIVSPNETGIYTGKIIVTSSDSTSKEVLAIISVISTSENKSLLFDATLRIPFFMKTRKLNSNLLTSINLFQIDAEEEVDVILKYVIKDFEDIVHFTESEEISIYKEKAFDKSFDLTGLPEGEYIVGLEIIYQENVFTANSQFNIKSRALNMLEVLGAIFFLAIIIVSVILIFIIRKRRRFMY